MQYIIVYGNPINGFKYIGVFDSNISAIEYADENITTEYDYWITTLENK